MKSDAGRKSGSAWIGAMMGIAVFVVAALAAVAPANAQQRKSLRWATSPVGSYGYQNRASKTQIVEEAPGGEHTAPGQSST